MVGKSIGMTPHSLKRNGTVSLLITSRESPTLRYDAQLCRHYINDYLVYFDVYQYF